MMIFLTNMHHIGRYAYWMHPSHIKMFAHLCGTTIHRLSKEQHFVMFFTQIWCITYDELKSWRVIKIMRKLCYSYYF